MSGLAIGCRLSALSFELSAEWVGVGEGVISRHGRQGFAAFAPTKLAGAAHCVRCVKLK